MAEEAGPRAPGHRVVVLGGPFRDVRGVMEAVAPAAWEVRVRRALFGRDTAVRLDVRQLRRLP